MIVNKTITIVVFIEQKPFWGILELYGFKKVYLKVKK